MTELPICVYYFPLLKSIHMFLTFFFVEMKNVISILNLKYLIIDHAMKYLFIWLSSQQTITYEIPMNIKVQPSKQTFTF